MLYWIPKIVESTIHFSYLVGVHHSTIRPTDLRLSASKSVAPQKVRTVGRAGRLAGPQELVHVLRESTIGAGIGSLPSSWLVSGFSVRGRFRTARTLWAGIRAARTAWMLWAVR